MDRLDIKPGRYIVAVSGGVDSIVLLELLGTNKDLDLVVAHFDHGIRNNSSLDRELVEKISNNKGLEFKFHEGNLGPDVSEEQAREARYNFLFELMRSENAKGIITAHHQDDLIETAIINLIRGTNRKGLSSLGSTNYLLRPLINTPKSDLVKYATNKKLSWNEDPTNSDTKYLRNLVRHNIVPELSLEQREQFLSLLNETKELNEELDTLMSTFVPGGIDNKELDRRWFINLPYDVAREVMASWLRANKISEFDKKMINKLVVGAKTLTSGKMVPIYGKNILLVKKDILALSTIDR